MGYELFSSVMIPILAFGKCMPKSEDILRKAFETISEETNDSKTIEWKDFEDKICAIGDKFKYDEIEQLNEFTGPLINSKGIFNYKDYIQHLCPQLDYEQYFKNSKYFNKNYILKSYGFNPLDE